VPQPPRRLAAAGALLALLLPAAPAAAVPQEAAGLGFEMAEGWSCREARDGVLLQRSFVTAERRGGRSTGQALIQISAARPPQGATLATAFGQFAAAGVPELARERPGTRGQGITTNGHAMIYERRCCGRRDGISLGATYVGIATPAGFHFSQLVLINLRGEERRAAEADYDALIRSLLLAPGDEPFRLTPPRGAGGLEGAYTFLDSGVRPNAFGGTDFYADNTVTVFDRSGLYSQALPKEGLDVAGHCRARPGDCGVYRLTGGRIERLEVSGHFGLLERDTADFAREGDDLKIGGRLYRRIPPLPAGTRLDGIWRFFFASTGSSASGSASVAAERLLQLSPDGRFRRSGFSGASSTSSIGGGTTGFTTGGQRPASSGRYEIGGHRLVLTADDGAREVMSLFMADPGSDRLLVIDGSNYLKREAEAAPVRRR
jgi:hypothetical protein